MERTFKVSWIQDTGLITATLLNERGLKSLQLTDDRGYAHFTSNRKGLLKGEEIEEGSRFCGFSMAG